MYHAVKPTGNNITCIHLEETSQLLWIYTMTNIFLEPVYFSEKNIRKHMTTLLCHRGPDLPGVVSVVTDNKQSFTEETTYSC